MKANQQSQSREIVGGKGSEKKVEGLTPTAARVKRVIQDEIMPSIREEKEGTSLLEKINRVFREKLSPESPEVIEVITKLTKLKSKTKIENKKDQIIASNYLTKLIRRIGQERV